ncbi:C3HC zinc finger-like-domain-containing protein [Geranomyces variabilis]|nr:C3HC zinc finger-like-domain-containing protein [Geranomyces variabilis]
MISKRKLDQAIAGFSYVPSGDSVKIQLKDQDLHNRLATFKEWTWFGLSDCLSPPTCARHGWTNISRSRLQCQMCRALVAFIPEEDGSNEDTVALERLKTAHDTGCLWARQSMEESAYRFPIISPPKIVHCFHIRSEKLIANPSDVPVSVFLHPIEERLAHLDIPGLANELKLTPHSDAAVTKASVLLALFGWDLVCAGSHRFLECALCARRAGLWNFSKVAPFSSGSADRDPKRIKLTGPQGVSPVLPDFAVWHQHRWYCPWVNNVNFKAGWITTLDAVQPLRLRKKAAPAGASPAQAQPSAAVTSLPPADHVTVNNGAEMSLHAAAGTLPATQGVASASSPPVIHVSDSETVARPSVRALNIESHQTLPLEVDSMPRSPSVQDASDSRAPSDDATTRPLSSKPIIVAPSPWPSTPATLATLGGQSGDHGSLSSVPLQQIFEGHRDHSNGTTTGEQGQTPFSSDLSRTELVQLNQPTPRAGADDEMKNANPDPTAKNQPLADGDRPATEAHMLFAPMHPIRMLDAVANEEAANEERGRPESAAMDWVSSIIQSAPSSPLQGFSEVDAPAARLVTANNPSFSLSHENDPMDVDAAAFVHPSAPASVDNDVSVVWDGGTRVANERNASDIEEFTR